MIGRRRFLGGMFGSPLTKPDSLLKISDQPAKADTVFHGYETAQNAYVGNDVASLSVLTEAGTKLNYVKAPPDTTQAPLVTQGRRKWIPDNGVLDIRQCASASDLARDFAGVCAQALDDAFANEWTFLISKGDWETTPIFYEAPVPGKLAIEFSPYAKLIGPAHFQHFAGDGIARTFTLTGWSTASSDRVTAMIVHQDNTYTMLRHQAAGGFDKDGTVVTLAPDRESVARGDTLVVSSRHSILTISGENGNLALRLRGGHFDNGKMGYVTSQASGSCAQLRSVRDVYWDGGPVFENSSRQSVYEKSLLNVSGDSGLVLANVERASIYGAQFLHQPDVGNYTTGLARGDNAEHYHKDDGRFINFFGAVAKGCGTGFRSARDGGGYGLYGCTVEEGYSGYLSANVSAGLPAARNINIQGLTCRKITHDAVDLRNVQAAVINGLLVEDWGRNADGTEPSDTKPLLSFGKVQHLDAQAVRCRFEEWTPVRSPAPIVSFANGRTSDARLRASLEMPYDAADTGSVGVSFSGGLTSDGDIELDLTTKNIHQPIVFGNNGPRRFVKAKVVEIRSDGKDTFAVDRYNIAQGRKYTETHGVPFERIVPFRPSATLAEKTVSSDDLSFGTCVQQGNVVTLKLRLSLSLIAEDQTLTSPLRVRLEALVLPPVTEPLSSVVSIGRGIGHGGALRHRGEAVGDVVYDPARPQELTLNFGSEMISTGHNGLADLRTAGETQVAVDASFVYISLPELS